MASGQLTSATWMKPVVTPPPLYKPVSCKPGGSVIKSSRGRESLRSLQHGKFLNGKVFCPIYLFKIKGACKKGQSYKVDVVDKRLKTTGTYRWGSFGDRPAPYPVIQDLFKRFLQHCSRCTKRVLPLFYIRLFSYFLGIALSGKIFKPPRSCQRLRLIDLLFQTTQPINKQKVTTFVHISTQSQRMVETRCNLKVTSNLLWCCTVFHQA